MNFHILEYIGNKANFCKGHWKIDFYQNLRNLISQLVCFIENLVMRDLIVPKKIVIVSIDRNLLLLFQIQSSWSRSVMDDIVMITVKCGEHEFITPGQAFRVKDSYISCANLFLLKFVCPSANSLTVFYIYILRTQ